MRIRKTLISLTAALVLAACATSPTGRTQLQFFPEDQLSQMGVAAYQQMLQQQQVASDPAVTRYVSCVARAVTEQLPDGQQPEWEVTVFKDPTANAFALPGGKIGVNTGLLDVAKTQSQLAAVIGHEVAHVVAQHANERISTAYATNAGLQLVQAIAGARGVESQNLMALLGLGAQVGVLLPFGRTQESEADVVGLEMIARAGFDPRESIDLWQNMAGAGGGQPPEFLSTHPAHGTRIEDLRKAMPEAMKVYEQARAAGQRPNCG